MNEIGSFHVGGRVLRLEGLPLRERVSTPGGPVHQVDPNGEIVAGQMYVQYVHSQGGNFGLAAALGAPERVRAVISLEPSGAPDPATADAARLKGVPHLFVWGDNWSGNPFWAKSRPASERWRDALIAAGCDVTWIDLPTRGVFGNSHALMADDNSDDIAAMVLEWLVARGLLQR